MKTVSLNNKYHKFEKQNLVTITTKRGGYDVMKCSKCGMVGKTNSLSTMRVRNKYKDNKIKFCTSTKKEREEEASKLTGVMIEITRCDAQGAIFANLTPTSIHEVIETPENQTVDDRGVWVMGVGEPVKVLNHEFRIV